MSGGAETGPMVSPVELPVAQPMVLVVDDVPGARLLLIEAVRQVLPDASVRQADSIAAVQPWLDRAYTLALIDLSLPDGRGSTIIRALKAGGTEMVAAVTVMDDDASIEEALAAGADGYLLKDSEPTLLVHRIERLVAGEPSLSPTIARRVLARFTGGTGAGLAGAGSTATGTSGGGLAVDSVPDILSHREREVLSLVARGLRASEVGGVLQISHHTVRDHLKSIYRKLNVSSRAEAALEAQRRNLT
ncbi:response regulator transcription factor [Sphingobium sufflavum]|uniref:LuxR C-terminal-related transcriptional regulator n=1 Tax=Sphingobium sufflavum TaxID=1129547 RepID=UPI001F409DA0|nr:response regulator transcription factor [Sphingobium sufflavum]MCE7795150.1 response regulator transcription factor [Sphingobium sufflavum]